MKNNLKNFMFNLSKAQKTAIFILTLTLVLILVAITSLHLKGSYAQIRTINVGVYADSECKQPIRTIWFGEVKQGTPYKFKIYLRNELDVNITVHFKTENWKPPEAKYYVFCYWDAENSILKPNEIKAANITLYVYPLIRKFEYREFSFDIIIVGEENCLTSPPLKR